jgi:homogentisate 1,2-dioxygenase
MPYYRRVGDVPAKRHTVGRSADGGDHEELLGQGGFSSSSSLLYHRRSPSALKAIEAVAADEPCFLPNMPVSPRHLRPHTLPPPASADPVTARRYLLGNADLRIAWVRASQDSPLYRNARGDELAFVHRGTARLESVFGALELAAGDYVVIPAGATHRWCLSTECDLLVVEATGHVEIPARYLTGEGQLREGAPYSERDLRAPGQPLCRDGDDVDVLVRTRGGLSRHVHVHHPFDVVGWDGHVYPWALSIHDFEPLVGRIHQPPPVHQTFAGPHFVVCSFVPRPYDFDPDAIKVPYHHANVDCDEVLYYVAGDFMSRAGSGIGPGSLSVHPAGFVHGPQPGSRERAAGEERTNEVAVMIDTFAPLGLSAAALDSSDPDYPFTWAGGGGGPS